uniref:Small ribosomal subunit protein mS29 n=3 Tax=Auxenochlorella protothecoides TaxID=3075 RepID=A0A1D2A603_AUXPR
MQRTCSAARSLLQFRACTGATWVNGLTAVSSSSTVKGVRGLAEVAAEDTKETPWHSGHSVATLHEAPTTRYFSIDPRAVPEAQADFYEEAYLKKEGLTQPNYGCTGVQRELASSGHSMLQHRPVIKTLLEHAQSLRKRRISLQGWTGSGKSVALYSLVAWARANDWVALYVPSAFSMVQGGTFNRGEDGLFDMPQAARYILQSMLQAHAGDLQALRTADGAQSLAELAGAGVRNTTAADVVAAAIRLKDELAGQTQRRVLLAVDDYNALYHRTTYGEAVHPLHRRQLQPDELRLVQGFRLMEQPAPANGLTVTAPTCGGRLPAALAVPLPRNSRVSVPRYNLQEVATAAAFYYDTGVITDVPTVPIVQRAFALSNGNAKELRHLAAVLLAENDPLGHSLGHKAADAAKRRMLRGEA